MASSAQTIQPTELCASATCSGGAATNIARARVAPQASPRALEVEVEVAQDGIVGLHVLVHPQRLPRRAERRVNVAVRALDDGQRHALLRRLKDLLEDGIVADVKRRAAPVIDARPAARHRARVGDMGERGTPRAAGTLCCHSSHRTCAGGARNASHTRLQLWLRCCGRHMVARYLKLAHEAHTACGHTGRPAAATVCASGSQGRRADAGVSRGRTSRCRQARRPQRGPSGASPRGRAAACRPRSVPRRRPRQPTVSRPRGSPGTTSA